MSDFPEAPASINFRVTYKGVEIQATSRDTETPLKPYFDKAKTAIDWALNNGFEVPVKGFPKKEAKPIEYVEGKACPKCGEKLVKAVTKQGKPFEKCSTQKYDFATKTTSGCDYVNWGQSNFENQ